MDAEDTYLKRAALEELSSEDAWVILRKYRLQLLAVSVGAGDCDVTRSGLAGTDDFLCVCQ